MIEKNKSRFFFVASFSLMFFIASLGLVPRVASAVSDSANATTSAMTPGIPGTTEAGGIIQCGRGGQNMCTICDLIKGLNIIIQYLLRIAVVVALTSITVGGGMYVVSTGNPGMTDLAKGAMKNAGIGLVVILTAWLMINTLLFTLGASSSLGIAGVTAWGDFECAASH